MLEQARPVAEGLFELTPEGPRLVGSRCRRCEIVTFPRQASCLRCTSGEVDEHLLAHHGTLWTWTIQCFRPKSPPYAGDETAEDFVPYGVGYVELGREVRVEGRLTESDPERLRIDMPMALTLVPAPGNPDAVTYAFRPLVEENS
jgi:uncharacterized OB-fold protein